MAKTLAEQLSSVQTAIEKIETKGQSVSFDGTSYTRANLKDLYEREKSLLRRIAHQSTHGRTVAEF
ncbi:MAG: hypothetical protein DRP62_05265 [Planctomycetota bacterium]|nr:MAG: hypothetical protein DRP62_05265 [Planctomycetota bacterium]